MGSKKIEEPEITLADGKKVDKTTFQDAVLALAYQHIHKYRRMEDAKIELNDHDKSIYSMALILHLYKKAEDQRNEGDKE